MSFVFFLIGTAFQIAGTFALFFGLVFLFFFAGSYFYPDYWLEDAAEAATSSLVLWLTFDRIFGPFARVIRDVGKSLVKARRKRNA